MGLWGGFRIGDCSKPHQFLPRRKVEVILHLSAHLFVEYIFQNLANGLGVDAADSVVPRFNERALGAAAFFTREDVVLAVPLLLLIPPAAVRRVVQEPTVFPIVGLAGVVVLNCEVGVFGNAVEFERLLIVVIELYHRKLDYHYEQPLEFDGVAKYPDFTIEDDNTGKTYYWEHCGLLHDPAYRRRWDEKKQWYREHDVLPREESGGPKGTLIETRDDAVGGINSQTISQILKDIFDK